MSRIALADIKSLTFFEGRKTKAKRTRAIPQLTCKGKACRRYKPQAVQCKNDGGEGVDVDWVCHADLPENLRFGKTEVSCEGWKRAGDPYVLKGSCALEYELVEIPGSFDKGTDLSTVLFGALWILVLLFILYHFFKSYFGRSSHGTNNSSDHPPPYPPGAPRSSGPPPDSGRWPWNSFNHPPPPPYSEQPKPGESSARQNSNAGPSGSGSAWEAFRPGFWSGVGLGGLGAAAADRLFRSGGRDPEADAARRRREQAARDADRYDWEYGGFSRRRRSPPRVPVEEVNEPRRSTPASSWFSPRPSQPVRRSATGGGSDSRQGSSSSSSGLGPTRQATGYGSSNVR